MGWWSENIGGGNSFGESVANAFTAGDGKEYQGGTLVDTNTNKVIGGGIMDSSSTGQNNNNAQVGSTSSGHGSSNSVGQIVSNTVSDVTGGLGSSIFGKTHTVAKGDTLSEIAQKNNTTVQALIDANPELAQDNGNVITVNQNLTIPFGGFNFGFNNKEEDTLKGTYKTSSTVGTAVSAGLTGGLSLIPKALGALTGWANGLDPENQAAGTYKDKNGKDNQVYDNGDGMLYSYNFLNLPYEVSIVDGKMVDTLSLPVDKNGNKYSDPNYDPDNLSDQTAYQYTASQNTGGDDDNNEIQQYADANAGIGEPTTGDGTGTGQSDYDKVLEMAKAAGFTDIKGTQEEIIANAMKYLKDRGLNVSDNVPELDADAEGTVMGDFEGLDDINMPDVNTVTDGVQVDSIANAEAATYDVTENVITDDMLATGVTGEIDSDNLVDADNIQIDVEAEAKGEGVMGDSLDNFASQNISTVINTSTAEGKMLAQALGEGNYTDHKATLMGQIKLISAEFKDSNGNARIPTWAQADLRGIQQTIAFGGMTGTAATEAYANAIMEATIGVADKEAAFFQTLTVKNLDNRQESIINKAKILAQFEMGNLDARETAAVQNAKAFLEMDLQNLTNEQQAMVINKQAMVDALFKNTEAINAQALFTAEGRNDMAKFYDELNASIQRHNATEINALKKFNAGEINDNSEFLADLRNSRQQYVANMQYNIDKMNATWRQDVATTNNQNKFDAASTDIKNALDITQEAQNALWDDADSLLDYIWKSADNDQQRELLLLTAQLQAQAGQQGGSSSSSFWKSVLSIGGAVLGAGSKPWWLGG